PLPCRPRRRGGAQQARGVSGAVSRFRLRSRRLEPVVRRHADLPRDLPTGGGAMSSAVRFGIADQSSIRERNRAVVLDAIRATSPTSRADVAKLVALTKPTVSTIVDELIRDGIVREIGVEHEPGVRGRPPIRIEYASRSQLVVGVNIGVQCVEVMVADGLGVGIVSRSESTAKGGPAGVISQVLDCVESTLAAAGAGAKNLVAISVCVPGRVVAATGVCQWAPNLGWRDVAVGAPIGERFRVPVAVRNDAQAALTAELTEGVAVGRKDVVLLYAGAGIGAAVLLGGEIYRGASGAVGELGHSHVAGERRLCNCGRRGCLETVASGPALERAARAAMLP